MLWHTQILGIRRAKWSFWQICICFSRDYHCWNYIKYFQCLASWQCLRYVFSPSSWTGCFCLCVTTPWNSGFLQTFSCVLEQLFHYTWYMPVATWVFQQLCPQKNLWLCSLLLVLTDQALSVGKHRPAVNIFKKNTGMCHDTRAAGTTLNSHLFSQYWNIIFSLSIYFYGTQRYKLIWYFVCIIFLLLLSTKKEKME